MLEIHWPRLWQRHSTTLTSCMITGSARHVCLEKGFNNAPSEMFKHVFEPLTSQWQAHISASLDWELLCCCCITNDTFGIYCLFFCFINIQLFPPSSSFKVEKYNTVKYRVSHSLDLRQDVYISFHLTAGQWSQIGCVSEWQLNVRVGRCRHVKLPGGQTGVHTFKEGHCKKCQICNCKDYKTNNYNFNSKSQ